MTHRFPIKEIAQQAGLGVATVDRVLNGRAHVSPQTKRRVAAAIEELEGQEAQLSARGRRMFIDFVVEAPLRFSAEVRRAAESVLPEIGAAVCRPRFVAQEVMREQDVIGALKRIRKRGSDGVCLKARDVPATRAAIDELHAAGIPVVTLVTDIQGSARLAYAGLDNASAGRSAAYLMAQSLGQGTGTVLTTQSSNQFFGEAERARAFEEVLMPLCPNLSIFELSGGSGLTFETARQVAAQISSLGDLVGVYSMGGGNKAILDTLQTHGITPKQFIAHDLDRENRSLLKEGRLTYVLHHDLRQDIRAAFHEILRKHGLMPRGSGAQRRSQIHIITPHNMPPVRAMGSV